MDKIMKFEKCWQSSLETVGFGLKANFVKNKQKSQRCEKESVSINSRTQRRKAAARNVGQRVGGAAIEKQCNHQGAGGAAEALQSAVDARGA